MVPRRQTLFLFFFTISSLTLLWPLWRKIDYLMEILTLLHLRCLGSSCTIRGFLNHFRLKSLFYLYCTTIFSLNYATRLYFLFWWQVSLILLCKRKLMSFCCSWTMRIMLRNNILSVWSCFQLLGQQIFIHLDVALWLMHLRKVFLNSQIFSNLLLSRIKIISWLLILLGKLMRSNVSISEIISHHCLFGLCWSSIWY